MSKSIENNINQIIKERRSIFADSFIEKEIPDTIIRQLLENANYAPTHKLTQPWRFTVFRKKAKDRLGKELAQLYKENTPEDKFLQKKYDSFPVKTSKAATIIAINIQFHPDKAVEWEEVAAVSCAVQNMLLTAQAYRIGAYWGTPGPIKFLNKFLGLKENEKCYGLLFLGYHEQQTREAKRTPIEEKVTWLES